MGLPTTQSGLTKYTSENGTPVITVLQNTSLQLKMDILSNEEVFKNWYIKEQSDTQPFKDIATSIGATVEDVVNENSIYSIMGDIVANNLNSTNKDGIGISASFNKFLAFAEKNNLTLIDALFGTVRLTSAVTEFGTVVDKADKESYTNQTNFLNTSGVRQVGGALGMFADAAKDPIPSVLNLNPGTASVSNLLMSMSGNLQLGVLINKIPFIEKITKEVALAKSNAQSKNTRVSTNTRSIIKSEVLKETLSKIGSEDRLHEVYKKDEEGKLTNELLPMYIETIDPNEQLSELIALRESQKSLDFKDQQPVDIKLYDVGFIVRYEDGSIVAEDVAEFYLGKVYADALAVNNDIIKLVRILNLIKDQKPDFNTLDMMLEDVQYFLSGESVFGSSIAKILSSSPEYLPLIEAAKKMSDYSKQIFVERSPLFKSLNSIIQSNFQGAFDNPKAKQNISDQIVKLLIIQKAKIDLNEKIKDLSGKTDELSEKNRELYENSLKYFTSDYWLNNNSITEDLDYLYENNQGNPFVEFLKTALRGNILLLEGSTRIKLDKDIAENINNGFEALQKSNDRKTSILARQLYYYLLVKDGLGYSNNSFLSYLNPDLKQFKDTSGHLDELQKLLKSQEKFTEQKKTELRKIIQNKSLKDDQRQAAINKISEEIYQNYMSLFNTYFKNKDKGNVDWIDIIIKKILANAANQKYIYNYWGTPKLKEDSAFNFVKEIVSLNLFPDTANNPGLVVKNKEFNFADFIGERKKFTIDFSQIANLDSARMYEEQYSNIFGRLIPMQVDRLTGKFAGAVFPMLIKTADDRLFKLAGLDGKSVGKSISLQSITGRIAETRGTTAVYTEIAIEGTRNMLNFGFTEEDGQKLYEQSLIRNNSYQSEEDYLFNLGATAFDPNYQGSDEMPPLDDQLQYEEPLTENEEIDALPDWAKEQMGIQKGTQPSTSAEEQEIEDLPDWAKEAMGIKKFDPNNNNLDEGDKPNDCGQG